ncbi:MAG: methylated-DNA--[protein]-cysteine S-methyltransferase [Treponema sp.]|nr:methylated-DNA--[protein]-cysteine S-methyltransferase [Treponema sp.]
MKCFYYYRFPLCKIGIAEEDGAICSVFFDGGRISDFFRKNGIGENETPLIKKAADQLGEYFDCKRKTFDLPLAPGGTAFQMTVWNALQMIPYGQTCSYGQLAAVIGNPKACRAVGMANNRNPISVIIPCHRVIGSDKSLTGYAGGLDLKEKLLMLERN